MFIKTRANCLCSMVLTLLVGHKIAFADPLLSASQQDLFKMSIGLKLGQPKDEPVYIERIPCAIWLFHTVNIHEEVSRQLESESRESVRETFYRAHIGVGQKLPSTSTAYLMFKAAIDQSLNGVNLAEVKSSVLGICNRYEDEYVTSAGGRSSDPNPQLKGVGKR